MAGLLIIAGPNEGFDHPLGQATVVLGRQESCPVQVTDDQVSRKHAQIRFVDGVHMINDRPIAAESRLRNHDVIGLGTTRLAYLAEDSPDAESAMTNCKKLGERFRSTIQT